MSHLNESTKENTMNCIECKSTKNIDEKFLSDFNISVCIPCKTFNHQYDYITKGDAKKKYLLSESSLQNLSYTLRENPRNRNFASVKLYLLCQVQSEAYRLYGNAEALNEEIEKRNKKRFKTAAKRVESVMKKKVKSLVKTEHETKTTYRPISMKDHQHQYTERFSNEDNSWYKDCECGISVSFSRI